MSQVLMSVPRPAAVASHPVSHAVRPLHAPVMASAQEELHLLMPVGAATGTSANLHASGGREAGLEALQIRLAACVRAHPGRAALWALGAGALLALVLPALAQRWWTYPR